jgi:hypothetical protein
LVVSRGLLDLLSASELEAVVAHEIGHGVRRHALQAVLLAVATILGVFLVNERISSGIDPLQDGADTPSNLIPTLASLSLLMLSGPAAVALLRRLELEADLHAALLTGGIDYLSIALHRMATQSGINPRRNGLRHFSIAFRRRFLEVFWVQRPELARRFFRMMGVGRVVSVVFCLVVLLWFTRFVVAESALGLAVLAAKTERAADAETYLRVALSVRESHLPSLLMLLELKLRAASDDVPSVLDRIVLVALPSERARRDAIEALEELQAQLYAKGDYALATRIRAGLSRLRERLS